MRVELVVATPDADLLVVNAARASFGKEVQEFSGKDAKLINYLAREKHVLPFRHPHITLRCKAPIVVVRQLMKHQVGMSWSEESRRYIDSPPEFYWPDAWRARADNVKQGSSDAEVVMITRTLKDESGTQWEQSPQYVADQFAAHAVSIYEDMLASGVAPELARMILPQSMMTTWVWTGSLLSWHHMLSLRLDAHTQKETRDFAQMVKEIIVPLAPVSMAALAEYSYEEPVEEGPTSPAV